MCTNSLHNFYFWIWYIVPVVDVAVLVDKASMLQPMYPCEAKVGVVDVAVLRDKVSMLSPLQWFVQLTWELQFTLNKHI